jgi:hypothetical protein
VCNLGQDWSGESREIVRRPLLFAGPVLDQLFRRGGSVAIFVVILLRAAFCLP